MSGKQLKAKGLAGHFVVTWTSGSSEQLANVKIDQLILAFNALLAKLDGDTGVQQDDFLAALGISQTMTDELIHSPPKADL